MPRAEDPLVEILLTTEEQRILAKTSPEAQILRRSSRVIVVDRIELGAIHIQLSSLLLLEPSS